MVDEKNILLVLVFVVGAVILLSFDPHFTGYSVKEDAAELSVTLLQVLPGEITKGELELQVNTDSVGYGIVLATGEAGQWITFTDEKYVFLPGIKTKIPFYVTVPEGTKEGRYTAKIALLAADSGEEGSILQNSIVSYIPVTITVSSVQKSASLAVDSLTVYTAEESDENVYFETVVSNLGNVGDTQDIHLDIYDMQGTIVHTQVIHSSFVAYEQKEIMSSFPEGLSRGKYYARTVIGNTSKSTSFSIVPDGSLKRKGELLALDTTVSKDNLVTITAYFKNTGESVVHAQLSGTVSQNDETVERFESDSQVLAPEQYTRFMYSYSELLSGSYALDAEIDSDHFVLAEEKKEFYSSHAVSLETNVVVILGLVMLLLLVSHYMLSRRKE